MTNQQLYLAIGIPVLLLLANTAAMFYLFSRVDRRIDELRGDVKDLSGRMDARFSEVDSRLLRLEDRLGRIDTVLSVHEYRLNQAEKKSA